MARPKTTGNTPQFSFRLDPALRADLEILAKADHDRSLGAYIEIVLKDHADENKDVIATLKNPEYAMNPDRTSLHAAEDPPKARKHRKAG